MSMLPKLRSIFIQSISQDQHPNRKSNTSKNQRDSRPRLHLLAHKQSFKYLVHQSERIMALP
jgi:hypothetical protein